MTNITKLIDDLAAVKAAQASLEREERAIKDALAGIPAGAYESDAYRLTISDTIRETPDDVLASGIKTAVAKYRATLSPQFLVAHTNKTPVRTHRIGAPTGKALAA